MAGMRDRLIHGYFGIDYELVWDELVARKYRAWMPWLCGLPLRLSWIGTKFIPVTQPWLSNLK